MKDATRYNCTSKGCVNTGKSRYTVKVACKAHVRYSKVCDNAGNGCKVKQQARCAAHAPRQNRSMVRARDQRTRLPFAVDALSLLTEQDLAEMRTIVGRRCGRRQIGQADMVLDEAFADVRRKLERAVRDHGTVSATTVTAIVRSSAAVVLSAPATLGKSDLVANVGEIVGDSPAYMSDPDFDADGWHMPTLFCLPPAMQQTLRAFARGELSDLDNRVRFAAAMYLQARK